MTSESMLIAARTIPTSSRISAAYMRVSTEDQDLSLQEDAIRGSGTTRTYKDKESGTLVERRAYTWLCKEILLGRISEVIVYRLDRLGRAGS